MRDVHDILASLRAAALRRAAFEGAVVGLAAATVTALVAAAWMTWGRSTGEARPVLLLAIVLAGAVPVVVRVLSASRRFATQEAAAARLEACVPGLRTDLRTALEFEGRPASTDPAVAELRDRLAARVASEVAPLGAVLGRFVPRRDLRRAGVALALAVVAGVAGAAASPEAFGRGVRHLALGVPATDDAGRTVSQAPLVSTVDYEIVPPAYTRRLGRRVFGSTGDVRAVTGSDIGFQARALVPATDAVLRIELGGETRRTRLEIDPSGRIAGRFPVTTDATWRFELTTPDGETLVDPVVRRIQAIPDEAPTVELLEPGESLEVTPDQVVDLRYVARDDFGLTAVSVTWYFAGHEGDARQLPVQGAIGTTSFEEHVPFDLLPLNLQPRDEVVLFVEATDNDQVSGAKVGRSRAVTLRVAAPEDRHDAVLAMKEELFEGLLRQLGGTLAAGMTRHVPAERADRIDLVPVTGTAAELAAALGAAREVHAKWPEAIGLFEALLAAMDEDPLSIDADRTLLRGTYERLYADVLDAGRVLDALSAEVAAAGVTPMQFEPAATRVGSVVRTTERTVLVLQDMIATHRGDDVARAVEELASVRERLRDLLEQYRDTRDPELRARIERELRRLEQRMRELLDRLAAQVEQLPYEHLNAEAIEPSELAENIGEMRSAMDMVRAMLDAGDIDAALSYLDQLEAELQGLDQQLSPLGDAEPQTLSEFDQRMGEMMDELNNLEALESELEAETQALLEQMMAQRAEAIRDQASRALEDAMEHVAEAREALDTLEDERLSSTSQAGLDAARDALRSIEELLSRQDAAGAEAAATRLLSQLSDTGWELRRDAAMLARDPAGRADAERALRRTASAEQDVGEARRILRELMQAAQPTPNADQRGRMDELAERQTQVRERLGQLQRQSQDMSQRFPAVGETLDPTLEQTGGQMEGAASELRGHRPRPALQGEQAALESMQQMREQMRQLTQRQRQREQREAGGRQSDDRVEVPEDGESSRAGFRRRVIESMRDDSLDAYEEEIRQYYERLLE